MSSARQGAGRYHPCLRSVVRSENMLQGMKSPNQLMSATTKTRRNLESLKDSARRMRGIGRKGKRHCVLKNDSKLLLVYSLPEWLSFLESI